MASGYSNHLAKQVGEFLVCAELGRRGLVATTFAGSVPGYDVVATNAGRKSMLLQVKTARSAGDTSYCWNLTGRFLDVATDAKTKRQTATRRVLGNDAQLIHVFVLLRGERCERDRFFLCYGRDVQEACFGSYTSYLVKHNHVRPKNPDSTANRLRPSDLRAFEDNWKLIETALAEPCEEKPASAHR